jgi:putative hydrolase of the HAD superfamily
MRWVSQSTSAERTCERNGRVPGGPHEVCLMKIEALIFDIGNVLVRFDWQIFHGQLKSGCPNFKVNLEREFTKLMVGLEIGEMSGESFARAAVRLIEYQGDEQQFVTIWNGIFTSNPPMERTVLGLKKRFPLFLLSNTSDLHLDYLKLNFKVLQHFVDGVYSFRARCAKPGREIYETAIRQFGLKPEKTIYIDDLPANVRAASELGFKAILYDLTKHAEFETRLAELGV